MLARLVRPFHAIARRDEVIGHLFDGLRDREKRIAKITAFWSSVGPLTGRHHGQPLAAHRPPVLSPASHSPAGIVRDDAGRSMCPGSCRASDGKGTPDRAQPGAWDGGPQRRIAVAHGLDTMSDDDMSRLLLAAFHHQVLEPDSDAGLDRLAALIGGTSKDDMRLAVANVVAAGYIHDPVRLPAGALQCHWHLELTPRGVEAARRLRISAGDLQ